MNLSSSALERINSTLRMINITGYASRDGIRNSLLTLPKSEFDGPTYASYLYLKKRIGFEEEAAHKVKGVIKKGAYIPAWHSTKRELSGLYVLLLVQAGILRVEGARILQTPKQPQVPREG